MPPSPTNAQPAPGKQVAPHPAARLHTSIQTKQTWIPVLLTGGIAFPIFGIIPLFADPYSPFSTLKTWLPTAGILLGLLMLAVGILNMLQVRALLDQLAQLTPRPKDFYDSASGADPRHRPTDRL